MSKKKIEAWPIGIIAAFAIFIGGILFAVSIMVRNDVPLISNDYYAQEIAYQDQLDKSNRGIAPATKPAIKLLAEAQTVEITFPSKSEGNELTGKVTFFRPSDPKKDFAVEVRTNAAGTQWVNMQDRIKGLWLVQIAWKDSGIDYYYEEQLMI